MITDTQKNRIRVMVVEDSPVVRDFLTHILNLVPDLEVVGVAHDGVQAIDMAKKCRPDVITMDIHMPKMDGFEATRRIMETCAKPIVIVSGSSTVGESVTACKALGAGALAVIARPYGFGHPEFASSTEKLVETVRTMAGVKVVRRWAARTTDATPRPQPERPKAPAAEPVAPVTPAAVMSTVRSIPRLVAIGASTGGPAAIAAILTEVPRNAPFPIVIVQHICAGFTEGFGEWLADTTGSQVHVGTDGMQMVNGHVYVAPSEFHMGVSGMGRIKLSAEPPDNGLKPSVAHLFRSVASSYGPALMAILLTGMGADGAVELKTVRDRGGITIAQDAASSVVHGMPGEAIRMGGAMHVMTPEKIGALLRSLSGT